MQSPCGTNNGSQWLRIIIGACLALSWAAAPAQSPADNFRKILPAIQILLLSGEDRRGVYNIFTDHLNTPRLITNQAGQAVWNWPNDDAFGANPPNENPSGLGIFVLDPGFSGQVRNRETGTFYNGFRDCYDPAIGRYCQADPIGLAGDINLYAYVMGNPLSFTDPHGLETILITTYDYGIGSHSALYVVTPGQLPFLYDPAGSYQPGKEPRSSGGFFEGAQANLDKYIQYQQSLGSRVDLVRLPTTPAQERAIKQQAEDIADPRGFSCSRAVSGALGGVCGIPGSGFPGILRRQAAGAQCKP